MNKEDYKLHLQNRVYQTRIAHIRVLQQQINDLEILLQNACEGLSWKELVDAGQRYKGMMKYRRDNKSTILEAHKIITAYSNMMNEESTQGDERFVKQKDEEDMRGHIE